MIFSIIKILLCVQAVRPAAAVLSVGCQDPGEGGSPQEHPGEERAEETHHQQHQALHPEHGHLLPDQGRHSPRGQGGSQSQEYSQVYIG